MMKAEEIEGRVKILENATRLQYPNCIVVFEIEYLVNEKQFYIFGDDAVALSVALGAELKTGKDGYYICLPSFTEGFLTNFAAQMGRPLYKFQELTKIKTTQDFSLN